ncbi:small ribosomal subunit protein mS37 [Oratosquilla oratoria]|uniref:small ribosomal subunit protein mS37 n=1 Tax=Oratosquilla oratoria TaxID=337810 RepID=UPI003F7587EA
MRLTPLILSSQYKINGYRPKNGRRLTRTPFPFQDILPLALKDSVSGKGNKTQNVACLHEMSLLFACFKKNDFKESKCPQEIESFQKCHIRFMEMERTRSLQEREGVLIPGAKQMSHKQINILLRKYPQPK